MGEKIPIYIAAPFELLMTAREVRVMLESSGRYVVTSRWLEEDPDLNLIGSDGKLREMAERDLVDIDNSRGLVAINPETWRKAGTGGRHVELGYAIAKKLPIWIIGVTSNVYHHHPQVHLVSPSPLTIWAALDVAFATAFWC